jgi:hypothetical protein
MRKEIYEFRKRALEARLQLAWGRDDTKRQLEELEKEYEKEHARTRKN